MAVYAQDHHPVYARSEVVNSLHANIDVVDLWIHNVAREWVHVSVLVV